MKRVSSFSAEPAYLHLIEYFAKKMKVNKNQFIRLCIAEFAHRFLTAKELDSKPLVRRWYVEAIEREIFGNTRLKKLLNEVEDEDREIFKSRR